MKKRLRKKLRLREFQEMGFRVRFDFIDPKDDEFFTDFWQRLTQLSEANHLLMGGSLDDFFVQTNSRCPAIEADREALATWLHQQPKITNSNVSPLVDAWYGPFE